MLRRRRPLLRAAAVGGGAYAAGTRRAQRQAEEQQAYADQDARISRWSNSRWRRSDEIRVGRAAKLCRPDPRAPSFSDQLSGIKRLHDQHPHRRGVHGVAAGAPLEPAARLAVRTVLDVRRLERSHHPGPGHISSTRRGTSRAGSPAREPSESGTSYGIRGLQSRRISITSAPKSSSRVRKAANAAWSGSGPCSTVSTGAGSALSRSKSRKTS